MSIVTLKRNISNRVFLGHPWIFNNEVERVSSGVEAGDIVEVQSYDKKFVGKGYINPKSQIVVRLLSRNREEKIDDEFFHRKLLKAWAYRQKIGYTENCRLVFGEADDLPQLIIDKFNEYFVVQTLALGIDKWKGSIVSALISIFNPKGIYERNDVPVRELEGLPQLTGFLSEPFDTNIIIRENDLRFHVDLAHGQKTGYFLDQQHNRQSIQHIVKDAEVLGAFTYTGAFEIHAAHYGAKRVVGVDISENAVAHANRNAQLNGYSCEFMAANAFDILKDWSAQRISFDVVMLDPPSFAKSRSNIEQALRGYKEINLRGMKLLRSGGFLVTSSCTNLVTEQLFIETIQQAAQDAKRKLRQVLFQTQSSDHPVIWNIDATKYLKFLIVQVE